MNHQDKPSLEPMGGRKSDVPAQIGQLLARAFAVKATDIHIDPVGMNRYRICYRVDGVIQPGEEISSGEGRQLVNQLKVAAEAPTDRRFTPWENRLSLGEEMFSHEIRVTIMPTTRQEAVHLRMLSPPAEILKPTELGMPETALDSIRETLTQPEGLILISGPTGAGKTMTLYSLASFLKLESLIAVSVEDPVEYDLGYVRQVQADQEHGLFMQTALRSVLRMDPDIILIGEIRDTASAVTAVRAAASGRFVLATLHARDTALALEACHYYSIPRHLLGSTLQMVISQVLVRKVCHACADQREPTSDERELFSSQGLTPPARVPVPKGCDTCHHFGYLGQTGIFEVVVFDHAMGAAISRAQGAEAIRSMLAQEDIPTLRRAALNKVAQGITTLEEINDLHFPGG